MLQALSLRLLARGQCAEENSIALLMKYIKMESEMFDLNTSLSANAGEGENWKTIRDRSRDGSTHTVSLEELATKT